MQIPLKAVRLTHEHATAEIRELIYLPESTCKLLLSHLRETLEIREALIFSTCNRTEIFYLDEQDRSQEIIKLLGIAKGIPDILDYLPLFQLVLEEEKAVRQLFEISLGLNSAILGDIQIANQIKYAYRWANDMEMAQAYLHRLMHTIFHTNKRVQQETPFRDGAASVSYAATELASELSGHLKNPQVLVIGLGEMGMDVARTLDEDIFGEIHLMNRTASKAESLAGEIGGKAYPLEELADRIFGYDVILSCVSVKQPLIDMEMLRNDALRSPVFIDLAMPASVSRDIENLDSVVLYNIDDISERTSQALERRKAAIPQVEKIIAQEVEGFLTWRQQLSISPTIHRIKEALEKIRKEELARFLKTASFKESQLLEDATRSMINKILRMPVLQLKAACKRGEQDELIDLINDLFDLERSQKPQKK